MISEYTGNVTFPICGERSISAYEAGPRWEKDNNDIDASERSSNVEVQRSPPRTRNACRRTPSRLKHSCSSASYKNWLDQATDLNDWMPNFGGVLWHGRNQSDIQTVRTNTMCLNYVSCLGASVDCVRYVTARRLQFQTPNSHKVQFLLKANTNLKSASPFHTGRLTDTFGVLFIAISSSLAVGFTISPAGVELSYLTRIKFPFTAVFSLRDPYSMLWCSSITP